ncbi:arginine-hydroxylase NDUFAF5, mitochondrial-like [Tubulanus polymorphus]|uniref:arginine-hydroxylase NDUFAF5, mitochondrial-like n=1 Tax=Tubulanus polymorphus TaxID=672921 RepID=UPI003DA54976
MNITNLQLYRGISRKLINIFKPRRSACLHPNIQYNQRNGYLMTLCQHSSAAAPNGSSPMAMVFDRKAKRNQRNRTAFLKNYEDYDYIKEEFGFRLYDRICDIKRQFNLMVELGCGRGHIAKHITADIVTDRIIQCDWAEQVLNQAAISKEVKTEKRIVDEESIPFEPNSIDIVVSNLSLHWVNDLPGSLKQINNCLKEDGVLIGSMFGHETLFELRVALQQAELELEGGFGIHVSPFAECTDIGRLLNQAGFTLITLDLDALVVSYPSMIELLQDLKGMGENNCTLNRKTHLHRKTVKRAAEIYQEKFGNEGKESIPATFEVIHFIGWKPHPSQAKPAKRGSGQMSIKDLGEFEKIAKERKIHVISDTDVDATKKDDS